MKVDIILLYHTAAVVLLVFLVALATLNEMNLTVSYISEFCENRTGVHTIILPNGDVTTVNCTRINEQGITALSTVNFKYDEK